LIKWKLALLNDLLSGVYRMKEQGTVVYKTENV